MANRRADKRERARQDLAEIALHLTRESGSEELGLRFLEATADAFEQLVAMPEIGAPRDFPNPRLRRLRLWVVQGFPNHLIWYLPTADGIDVVRVLHAARDQGEILSRE